MVLYGATVRPRRILKTCMTSNFWTWIQVHDRVRVKPLLEKQDVTLSDQSGTIKLTLWQSDIGSLKVETTYNFTNLSVRSYLNTKYLSHSMSGLEYDVIDDMSDVVQAIDGDEPDLLRDASVVVILNIKKIKSCIACNKRVEASSETLGQCVKCSAFQRLDGCASDASAKVLIESNGNRHTLHAYLHSICQIAAGDDLTADSADEKIIECLHLSILFSTV